MLSNSAVPARKTEFVEEDKKFQSNECRKFIESRIILQDVYRIEESFSQNKPYRESLFSIFLCQMTKMQKVKDKGQKVKDKGQ